jgi:metal-responsive CopG/Arc/MetJ family transcriptional regulator
MVAGVARKQVLVQLDDVLVGRLDRAASALALSRSVLIRRAVDAYLDACEEAGEDALAVAAYLRVPDDPAELAAFEALALQAWPDR